MKKVKFILPFLAFVFAIGSALAIKPTAVNEVSLAANPSCVDIGTCSGGAGTCKDDDNRALFWISGTACTSPATGSFTED